MIAIWPYLCRNMAVSIVYENTEPDIWWICYAQLHDGTLTGQNWIKMDKNDKNGAMFKYWKTTIIVY